jgi:hypothetical protein
LNPESHMSFPLPLRTRRQPTANPQLSLAVGSEVFELRSSKGDVLWVDPRMALKNWAQWGIIVADHRWRGYVVHLQGVQVTP